MPKREVQWLEVVLIKEVDKNPSHQYILDS